MADRSSIQEQLLDTMKIIAQNEASKIQFDKTVLAMIWAVEDESKGQYRIKDQDSFYTAYSNNLNVTYKVKESVYVQIPENNYSNTKMIIGSVNQLGTEYVNVIEDKDRVNLIGVNCFESDKRFILKSSTVTEEKQNYIDITQYINKDAFSLYIRQSIGLMISMDVQTAFAENNRKGNYGLKLTCKFYDSNEQDVYRVYYLDTPKMIGNPFGLSQKTNQYVIYDMDVEKFQSVEECILFAKDFVYNGEDPDIFISNIEMNFVEELSEEELGGYSLNLRTPKGTIFSSASDSELLMRMELKVKGKNATLNSSNSEFYWFIEDASVDYDSPYYSSYGDRGWRCLNDKLTSGQTSYFVSGKQEYTVHRNDVAVSEVTFKGVVVYNGVVVSELKRFQNLEALRSIVIESTRGTEFYFDAGSTELTCKVYNLLGQEITENFKYAWGRYDSNGSYVEKINEQKSCIIEVNSIVTLNTIRCSVFNQSSQLIGTGNIILTNKIDAEPGYTLVINHSNKLYYYDVNGDAPNDPIPQLTLTVYDPKGNEVDLSIDVHKTRWIIPTDSTLLIFEDGTNFNADTLSYKIASRFDKNKINNNISVEMKLRGVTLTAETSFIFTKEGDIGTNGTSYYCRIVPTIEEYNFPVNGTAIKRPVERLYFVCLAGMWYVVYISTPDIDNDNIQYRSNLIPFNGATNYFRCLLYKEGRVLIDGVSYSWYAGLGAGEVGYNYDNRATNSMFTVVGTNNYARPVFKNPRSHTMTENIIKVKVTENSTGNTFYSSIAVPISVNEGNSNESEAIIPENNGFGFDEVVYNNDGSEPKYTKNTFKIKNRNVSWNISNYNLKIQQQNTRTLDVIPINPFVSEITDNYVKAQISDTCYFIYPIIMHLNTSGIGMLNDWDGSKYGVNGEDGTYILAPQVGAGVKDNNNMFTGILIGEIRNRGTYNSSNRAQQVGLFGYTVGKQMFSLTPYNSIMSLGLSGSGQIIFNGTNGVIESGSYQQRKEGLSIDLTNGKWFINAMTGIGDNSHSGAYMGADGIRIGNKDSYLLYNQSNAKLTVKGTIEADAGHIGGSGGWTITDGAIYSGNKSSLNSSETGAFLGTRGINIGSSTKYMKYANGNLEVKGDITADKIEADAGYIGDWEIIDGRLQSTSSKSIIRGGIIQGATIRNEGYADIAFEANEEEVSIGDFYVSNYGGRHIFQSRDEVTGLSAYTGGGRYLIWAGYGMGSNADSLFQVNSGGQVTIDQDLYVYGDIYLNGKNIRNIFGSGGNTPCAREGYECSEEGCDDTGCDDTSGCPYEGCVGQTCGPGVV